ncbi:hypothetical protein ACFFX0_29035 [Citricoccus parietis]|uniref:Uncharacterized protein n=1 Tax=Citricoccus parietis TaxID=592307 RepID=A0ABV5G7S3_9MICC
MLPAMGRLVSSSPPGSHGHAHCPCSWCRPACGGCDDGHRRRGLRPRGVGRYRQCGQDDPGHGRGEGRGRTSGSGHL